MNALRVFAAALVGLALLASPARAQWESDVVRSGANDRLAYVADGEGNRVPDFSHAGYRGGDSPIPSFTVRRTLSPSSGDVDDTARIQQAIDDVSDRTPDSEGRRGAVRLLAGEYRVDGTLRIEVSGVMLQGAGDNSDPSTNTVLRRRRLASSAEAEAPILVLGRTDSNAFTSERSGTRSAITTEHVPAGARTFRVADASKFQDDDEVVVRHPTTNAWLSAVDFGGADGDPPWNPPGSGAAQIQDLVYIRHVVGVEGDRLLLDAPVFNRLDGDVTDPYVYKRSTTGITYDVGVERLRIDIATAESEGEPRPGNCDGNQGYDGPFERHARHAVELFRVKDGWVRDVTALHFWRAAVNVERSSHVTVADSRGLAPHSCVTAGRRYNFVVSLSQLVLFRDNEATRARHAYVGNGAARDNGVAFVRNESRYALYASEAHRQWGQGFLFDNHVERDIDRSALATDIRIGLYNRGQLGTSHGWSCTNCVAWNADMDDGAVSVQKPPTGQNYAIGTTGKASGVESPGANPQTDPPVGYIEGTNRSGLRPASLYEAQLDDRRRSPSCGPLPTDRWFALRSRDAEANGYGPYLRATGGRGVFLDGEALNKHTQQWRAVVPPNTDGTVCLLVNRDADWKGDPATLRVRADGTLYLSDAGDTKHTQQWRWLTPPNGPGLRFVLENRDARRKRSEAYLRVRSDETLYLADRPLRLFTQQWDVVSVPNGAWSGDLTATTEEPSAAEAAFAVAGVAPNPAGETAAVRVLLGEAAEVSAEVFDVLGRRVLAAPVVRLAAGEHDVPVVLGGLPTGAYTVRVTSRSARGVEVGTARVTVVR